MALPLFSPIILRDYQKVLVDNVVSAVSRGDKDTLVIASCGAGKTVCMVKIAEILLDNAREDEVVLILSHLSLLTIQTKAKFARFSPLPVGVLQASVMPSSDDKVVISTMQSSVDFSKIATYYDQCKKIVKYIIIDEAHCRWSNSYKSILDTFPNAQAIDFTATPYIGNRLAVSQYTSVAFQISLEEMINNKYLVPPVLRQILIDNDTPEKKCALFMKTYQQFEDGKKSIFFLRTKAECKLLCDAFINEGVKAAIVTDAISANKREKIFGGYEANEYDVLLTVNVLTAGFDTLVCESIFMLGTGSPIVYMQRMGRALRPIDGDSVKPHHTKQTSRIYVFGELPEIESGKFEKTHNLTVSPKKYSECVTLEEKMDYLEVNEQTDSEEYLLCKASIKVQRLAKKIDMPTLLSLMSEQAIPDRFMHKLADGVDTFKKLQGGDVLASSNQLSTLKAKGVNPPPGLTSNEASFIIHSLTGSGMNHNNNSKFILTEGKFKGSHIRDISFAYKSLVVRKWPNSPLAKLIKEFHPKIR